MPTRPDLRDIASNVRDALGDCDRDTLVDLLTFVLKEYVVEGPPPMLVHQTETIADLGGLSFAQLVTALQTRLDIPELALFVVDGDRVSVRVGGVVQPLVASRTAPDAAELPRPQSGVRVVEAQLPRPPVQMAAEARPAPQPAPPAQPVAQAPRPTQGLSLRGAPTVGGGAPSPSPSSSPAPAPSSSPQGQGQGQAQPPASGPAKEGADGDDAAARFSLLELD
jgi:hypothetical protein